MKVIIIYASPADQDWVQKIQAELDKWGLKAILELASAHKVPEKVFKEDSSYFLKDNGTLAFVLPRSFFSADHHDNTRSGKAKGFRISQVWDLDGVSPLFRIPSSVLFAQKEKDNSKRNLPAGGLDGISFSGNIPAHNCNLESAKNALTETNTKWYYAKQGSSTAFSNRMALGTVYNYKNFKFDNTLLLLKSGNSVSSAASS